MSGKRKYEFIVDRKEQVVRYYIVTPTGNSFIFALPFPSHARASHFSDEAQLASQASDTWNEEADIATLIARDKLIEEGLIPDEWVGGVVPLIMSRLQLAP